MEKGKTGKFRFRLKAANGEIIAASEAYETKKACEDGIASVRKNASVAKIKDISKKRSASLSFSILALSDAGSETNASKPIQKGSCN